MTKREQQLSQWRDHNKWLKSRHLPTQTFDEYLSVLCGKVSIPKAFRPLQQSTTYRRDTPTYKSVPMTNHVPAKQEPMKYDGERRLIGIATMHKSNMVPVFDEESAKDLARMRR
jgi:hypothetical protein